MSLEKLENPNVEMLSLKLNLKNLHVSNWLHSMDLPCTLVAQNKAKSR